VHSYSCTDGGTDSCANGSTNGSAYYCANGSAYSGAYCCANTCTDHYPDKHR
jgi:hypothetical protein